jgi:hypothetical protein
MKSHVLLAAFALASCVHSARGQVASDVAAVLGSAFRAERDSVVHRRIIVSPFHFTVERPPPKWSPMDLSLVLADTNVQLAEVDAARCPQPEPLTCVLKTGEVGFVFGTPRIVSDSAQVRMKILGRLGAGSRFSMSYIAITLRKERGVWIAVNRRWLGGT